MNRLSTKHLTFKGLLSLVVACPKLFCLWTPEVLQRVERVGVPAVPFQSRLLFRVPINEPQRVAAFLFSVRSLCCRVCVD